MHKTVKSLRAARALLSVFFLSTLAVCSMTKSSNTRFEVTLTVFTHGTHRLETYRLRNEGITAIRHPRNGSPDVVIADRTLTNDECSRLERYFHAFPLESLSGRYVNSRVEGEIHRTFDITINGWSRTILVYFMKQKDLDVLADEIFRLISKQ